MATLFNGEGNIGSAPEWRTVQGAKADRYVLRLNVYFDNPVPVGDEIIDRGGFWRDIEWWHRDAEHLASLFQVGMRVLVRGNEILDTWDEGQKSAFKVQASRVAILPVRLSSVTMKPKEHEAKSEGAADKDQQEPEPETPEQGETQKRSGSRK